MSRGSNAALLSGLIFPGAGHLALGHYWRGSALVGVTLAALGVLIRSVFQRALPLVDRINAGEVAPDFGTILDMMRGSTGGANSSAENAALIVLLICWLIGIVDAYRLGVGKQS